MPLFTRKTTLSAQTSDNISGRPNCSQPDLSLRLELLSRARRLVVSRARLDDLDHPGRWPLSPGPKGKGDQGEPGRDAAPSPVTKKK